jgi:hypothetical protein
VWRDNLDRWTHLSNPILALVLCASTAQLATRYLSTVQSARHLVRHFPYGCSNVAFPDSEDRMQRLGAADDRR